VVHRRHARALCGYGWNVIAGVDGHNALAVDAAIQQAKAQAALPSGKPTLICCKTVIGQGSPNKAGGHDVHGAALGAAEVAATRVNLGWTEPPFVIPSDIAQAWSAVARGARAHSEWNQACVAYRDQYPALAAELERRMAGQLPAALGDKLPGILEAVSAKTDTVATRKASQNALDMLSPLLPEFLGGSADLTGSNLTNFKGCTKAGVDANGQFQGGNYLSYGVREFGMAAIMNGLALHGGFIPFGGTFLTFSDYSRNAIRMAALMKRRVIHVFTHDSIGLGEDGPTHQSVEHVPSLRIIPNLDTWRPADGLETAVAWACAVERNDGPSALCLSRQNLPAMSKLNQVEGIRRGGYVLFDMPQARAAIVSTGSELELAMQAQAHLAKLGIATRVVSMPCTNRFDRQSVAYQNDVLPLNLPAVAIEAAQPDFWRKYVGRSGKVVGMPAFGESAPAKDLYAHFGITANAVVQAVAELLESSPK
jgi:transketolase